MQPALLIWTVFKFKINIPLLNYYRFDNYLVHKMEAHLLLTFSLKTFSENAKKCSQITITTTTVTVSAPRCVCLNSSTTATGGRTARRTRSSRSRPRGHRRRVSVYQAPLFVCGFFLSSSLIKRRVNRAIIGGSNGLSGAVRTHVPLPKDCGYQDTRFTQFINN
jgi:hypothetical protein